MRAPEAPEGLGEAGLAAWRRAAVAVGDPVALARFADAVDRFAWAVDLVHRTREEWHALRRPMVSANPNGATGVHPVLKLLLEAERAVANAGAALALDPAAQPRMLGSARGRPVGAASAPDRRPEPPRVRLKPSRPPGA